MKTVTSTTSSKLHPEVRVELLLSNDNLDIIASEIDVAMRVGTLADSNLAARRLSVPHTSVYAAPSYIERFGEPLHPDEPVHHRTLAQTNHRSASAFAWKLGDGDGDGDGTPRDFPVDPVMVSNDPGALRAVLLDGEAIMLTSEVMVRAYVEQGLVQRALASWRGLDIDLHALFPRGQVQTPKVRAFVDFLVERLRVEENYMRALSDDETAHRVHDSLAVPARESLGELAMSVEQNGQEDHVRLEASCNVVGVTVGPIACACGVKASGGRRLATATSDKGDGGN